MPPNAPDEIDGFQRVSSNVPKSKLPLTNFTNNSSTVNVIPTKAITSVGGPPLPSWVLDEREAAQIARRRRILQERAVRIHQPRTTSIAVDVDALSHQVAERRRQEEAEQRRDRDYEHLALTQDKAALLLQQQEDNVRKTKHQQLVRFWGDNQRPERRREYDLNSHEHVTSSLYLLSFDGEDEGMRDRIKQQQQQTKAWLEQQKEEQHKQHLLQKENERLEELQQMEFAERAKQLAEADEQCRRGLELAHVQYNRLLSRERNNTKVEQKLADLKADEQEVRNAVLGAFLTEDPDMARSALGPHRVIVDRWKGMSREQKQEIENIRSKQVQEKKRRDEEEKRRDKSWEEHAMRVDRAGVLLAHKEELQRRNEEDELVSSNNHLARNQKLNQSRLNSILTTNIPTQEYYRHFGVYPR